MNAESLADRVGKHVESLGEAQHHRFERENPTMVTERGRGPIQQRRWRTALDPTRLLRNGSCASEAGRRNRPLASSQPRLSSR